MAVEPIEVKYTERGFEQDSGQAMKNDVVRALIELITNCDDAYARAKKKGTIEVIVRRAKDTATEIVVRDRATGLDPDAMRHNFTVLGGDDSGFAVGEDVRGLFDRGSKDTAWFGETRFESIKDGVYTRLVLRSDGKGEIESMPADDTHHTALGLAAGENGLSATMVIKRRDTRVPPLRDLVERLTSHVQLRQVITTQDVSIKEFRDGKLSPIPVVAWEPPAGDVLFDGTITVPGYDCDAHLVIKKLQNRSDGPVNEYSQHGIEVRGRRAAYMNTMFAQTDASTALIAGVLTCPTIDDLIRSFGAPGAQDEKNPMRLVSRSRDGLEETHPFMKALTVAVLEKLKPIIDQLEPKASETGSVELRRDLSLLSQLLAEEMKGDLDEEDDNGVGGNLPTLANPIIVIPPVVKARVGSKRTLTVLVHEGSQAAAGVKVSVSSVACSTIGSPTAFLPHPTFAETLVCQVRLAMNALGSATVVVSAESDPNEAGSSQVVVIDGDADEEPPTQLEWKSTSMSVTVGKTRSVRLRAPIELAPSGEIDAMIALDGDNISLEDDVVTLRLTSKGWLEARVRVTGVTHQPQSSTLVATSGGEVAEGSIKTILPNPLSGLNLDTEIVDKFSGPSRGRVDPVDTGLKLKMFGRHPGLSARLGTYNATDGSWSRDTEQDTLAVIAEVMASVAADHVLRDKVTRDPAKFPDVHMVVFERTKLVDRYLRILLEGVRAASGK